MLRRVLNAVGSEDSSRIAFASGERRRHNLAGVTQAARQTTVGGGSGLRTAVKSRRPDRWPSHAQDASEARFYAGRGVRHPASERVVTGVSDTNYARFFLGGTNDNLSTYRDRLLMRLHEYPPYASKLHQVARQDGKTLELVFSAMPEDAVNGLRELIGPVNTKIVFKAWRNDNGEPMLGVQITPSGLEPEENQ